MVWTKEKQAAYYAEWKARNLEHWKQYQRAYRQRNREKRIAAAMVWNRANRDASNARIADWKRRNPDKVLDYQHRRRARMRAADYEPIDRQRVFDRDNWTCHLCRQPVPHATASVDHLVPIADGGSHTYANVATAHIACNVRRGRKPLDSLPR